MFDIQTVSIMLASVSVIAGVVYYALQLRHQIKQRQTDLLVRLFSMLMTKDFAEAWEKVAEREILDFRAYREKYGFIEADEVFWFFEQLGRLLQKRLIDIDLIPFPTDKSRAYGKNGSQQLKALERCGMNQNWVMGSNISTMK